MPLSTRTIIAMIIVALQLSACGGARTPGMAQDLVQNHVKCPRVDYFAPAWSADGSHIYYMAIRDLAIEFRVMTSFGKDDRLLGQILDIRDALAPQFSPDKTMVLFQRRNPARDYSRDYYILDLKTGQTRKVASLGYEASWSPDSQWFVFSTAVTGAGPITKVNVLTGKQVALTAPTSSILESRPYWSPDGKTIAFTTHEGPYKSVTLIAPDGSGYRKLSITHHDSKCTADNPDRGDMVWGWLPDSQALVVLHVCDASGHNPTLVTVEGDEISTLDWPALWWDDGVWSPDGRQVAFTTNEDWDNWVNIASTDSLDVRILSEHGVSPSWSPDGKRIAFVDIGNPEFPEDPGFEEIFTVHPDGTGLTQLTSNPGRAAICLH